MLNRTFGCIRVVWNRTLAWRHQRYYGEQVKTNFAQANAYLTAMKATEELAWLNEVSSVPLQQAIRHQQVAYTNFFAKRARYPRFKSRNGRQSAEYTRSGFRYRDGALWLAKMDTPLEFVWSWPDIDPASIEPTTVTVSRDPCGRWYVSLAVEVADPEQLPATGAVVGVDLGIKDFATPTRLICHPPPWAPRIRAVSIQAARMEGHCDHGTDGRLVRHAGRVRGGEGAGAFLGYPGPDLDGWVRDTLDQPHLVIMGRVTYDALAAISSGATDPVSTRMNELPKVVFSSRLQEPLARANTRLMRGDLAAGIRALKQESALLLRSIGSLALVNSMLRLNLADRLGSRCSRSSWDPPAASPSSPAPPGPAWN